MNYLGFDIGTSACKTTVMDENEQILYESTVEYTYDEPQSGYREIEPGTWTEAIDQELANVFGSFDPDTFAVIGVTGQMHTTVFIDKQGSSIRPAIMWNDIRTASLVQPLKERCAKIDETKYIAQILSTGSPFVNTLWLKKNEPEHFARIHQILTPYDYIVFYLTGKTSCDYCDASTSSMYDIVSKTWSQVMLDQLELDASCLPEIHASCQTVGQLKPSLCRKFGVNRSIRVIAGTGDNPATAVAMGVINQSSPVISLGTSGVVILPKEDGDFDGKGKNVLFSTDNQKIFNIVQGTVQSAGGTHLWWIRKIMETNQMDLDQDRIHVEDLGKNEVLFYPHITGEKTLYADASLRGAFFGLGQGTVRKDMTQAVFEGVAFGFRELLENMNVKVWPTHIQINGGGTRSEIWMHIIANVLHADIEVVRLKATPGVGACMLAKMADGKPLKPALASSGQVIHPSLTVMEKYDQQYKKYKKIHSLLKQLDA